MFNKSTLIIAGLKILSWLPLPLLHGLAFIIGQLLYWLPNKLKKTAQTNLVLCFPNDSIEKRQQLLRKTLIESIKTALEMAAMWFWSIERLNKLNKGINGLEVLQTAIQENKGVIALTPHIGQWEFLGLLSYHYSPMTSLYRPPRLKELNEFLVNARKRTGNSLVPTTAFGVKSLYSSLKKGHMAGILPDQDPGNSGIFAPFFGIQTNTMSLVTKLAQRTDASIVIAYAQRLPWGQGYVTHIHPVNREGIIDKDPLLATGALNKTIEQCILECPEQYQWIYKRFKKRPENEAKIY